MGCERRRFAIFAGNRSTSLPQPYTSAALRTAHPHPSADRSGASGIAQASARECEVCVCVCVGAWCAAECAGLLKDGRAGLARRKARDQSSRAYAEARLRPRSGKRWPRHAVTASPSWLSQYPEHDVVRCPSAGSFQRGFGKTSQWGRSNKLDATRIHKATRSLGIAHQVGRAKHQALQLWKNLRHSSERKDRSTRRLPLQLLSHRRWQQQICTTTWQPSKGTFKPNTT